MQIMEAQWTGCLTPVLIGLLVVVVSGVGSRFVAISSTAGRATTVLVASGVSSSLCGGAEASIARIAKLVTARRLVAVASSSGHATAVLVATRVSISASGRAEASVA